MVKCLIDRGERRDVVLFYSNRNAGEIAYRPLFDEAARAIGLKTDYIITSTGKRMDAETIARDIPDYHERMFYISGTHAMTNAFHKTLRQMGVPPTHIKTDFFPGPRLWKISLMGMEPTIPHLQNLTDSSRCECEISQYNLLSQFHRLSISAKFIFTYCRIPLVPFFCKFILFCEKHIKCISKCLLVIASLTKNLPFKKRNDINYLPFMGDR